jgi:hypothetical protein
MSRHWKHGGSHGHSRLSRRCRRCRKGGEGSTQTFAARCIDRRTSKNQIDCFARSSDHPECCGAARLTGHSLLLHDLNLAQGLQRGTRQPFAIAAFAYAENPCICGMSVAEISLMSPKRSLKPATRHRIQIINSRLKRQTSVNS